jgi:deoxyribonuclease V
VTPRYERAKDSVEFRQLERCGDVFAALDVHYTGDRASTGVVLFHAIDAASPTREFVVETDRLEPYESGRFFRRELPCLMVALEGIRESLRLVFVDAFVRLGPDRLPGLGWYLHQKLEGRVAVIGVAKRPFADTPPSCFVYRGSSKRPLCVTSIGVEPQAARAMLESMHGRHRMPTLLRRADRVARGDVIAAPYG